MSSCSLVIVHASLKNMVSRKTRLKFLVPESGGRTWCDKKIHDLHNFSNSGLKFYMRIFEGICNRIMMKKKYRFFDPFTGEAPLKCIWRFLCGEMSDHRICLKFCVKNGINCGEASSKRRLNHPNGFFWGAKTEKSTSSSVKYPANRFLRLQWNSSSRIPTTKPYRHQKELSTSFTQFTRGTPEKMMQTLERQLVNFARWQSTGTRRVTCPTVLSETQHRCNAATTLFFRHNPL